MSFAEKDMEENDMEILPWPISASLLDRRRSCELTRKVAPCIEKAVTHLYELENQLNAIHDNFEKGKHDKDHRDQKQNWLVTDLLDDNDKQRVILSASGAKLKINGTGLIKMKREADSQPPSLTEYGEKVVRDTLLLLGRLETDRVNTSQSLAMQKQRVIMLKTRIDNYAHRRMHFMPIAVQKEHELCAINIQELKWHLAYKGRSMSRMTEKYKSAEKVNQKLKEEIQYINEKKPWVEKKIEEEEAQMEEIQSHQEATDAELAGALALLKSMEEKFSRAENHAERESDVLERDVDEVRQLLNGHTDELARYKMHYTSFVHSIHDARERLKEMEEEYEVLVSRHQHAIEMERIQGEKVKHFKKKIKEQEEERQKLMEENLRLRNEKDGQKLELESQNAVLDLDIKRQTKKLRELIASSRAAERDIKNLRKLIADSVSQRNEGTQVTKRAEIELLSVAKEAEILDEEVSTLTLVYEKLQETLENEREKCEKTEEDLKTTSESLKKQLKDEAHARTVLQARIAADNLELVKTKNDANKKRDKNTSRAEEIEKAVSSIKAQVEKMEKAHADRQKVISELDELLGKIKRQHEEVESAFKRQIKDLEQKEKEAKEVLQSLSKKLEEMEWKTDAMEKRMQDMTSSSVMMNRVLLSTQEAIEELSEELKELDIQQHAGQGILETLEITLKQLKERGMKSSKEHSDHLRKRENALELIESKLKVSLDENTKLAKLYSTTQNDFMVDKDEFLRMYEIAILKENSVKDKKELFDFRTRLHKALECYYKLRGVQTRAGIAKFEQLSHQNGERLVKIQTSLNETLNHINGFLNANNASHGFLRIHAEETARGSVEIST